MTTSLTYGSAGSPGGDERYRAVDQAVRRFGHEDGALLEVLNAAQAAFGFLSRGVLRHVASSLNVPLSRVYGVATFYDMFSLGPAGERRCRICTDAACSVQGAEEVLAAAKARTTGGDGAVTFERAACLGLCDQGPAALLDGVAYAHLDARGIESLLEGRAQRSRIGVTGEPRVMTRLVGRLGATDLEAHRAQGAFAAVEKALTVMTPDQVIEEVKASGLAGRGGAGFPTGVKWQYTRAARDVPKYVICNFDESEPGTFKDRVLMEGDPFRALEGAILCGYAVGARQGYVFVRGEYREASRIVEEAIGALYEAGLLGRGILGSGFDFDLSVRRSAGAYVCGEETAQFEAVEGKRGVPRVKPPFPTTHGVFGKPTAIDNVETLALVPDIVANGGAWLRQWGTGKSVGVKLFCLSGHVKRPGVVEAPYGLTVRELIERHGGGFDGEPQAILMGGAAGGFLDPDHFDTPLAGESLNPLGAPIGSGVIMVFNRSVDLTSVLLTLARFFARESCGKCSVCRVGTTQICNLLERIAAGRGAADDLGRLEALGGVMKKGCLCGLGSSAPNAMLSLLKRFPNLYPRAR